MKLNSCCLRSRNGAAAAVVLAGCLLLPGMGWTQQSRITPKMQAGISHDIARHFGSAPAHPGPKAKLSGAIRPRAVRRAMRKVGNWELKRARPYFGQDWTWGTLYAGFMAASRALHDRRYRRAMEQMGEKFHWGLESKVPDANDQCIGQTYLELYFKDRKPEEIKATQAALDRLLHGAEAHIPASQAQIPWWWCDALFMAPPAWSRMYAATHDSKYLTYMNRHWWQTSTALYDAHWHLYHRDITYLHVKGPNGKPVFWSRGEGWVMAGLVRTLQYLPKHYPTRGKFVTQLRQMASEIASIQDPKSGLWHANLLDSADYPQPETSGSALMTYALRGA